MILWGTLFLLKRIKINIKVRQEKIKRFYRQIVFLSAFSDGKDIVPVKIEVKEFKDKNNSLYVIVTLEKIKTDKKIETEVAGQADQKGTPKPYPISNIRITEIISKINPSEESIYQTNC